jgi:putative transcriptional regulator
MPEISNCIRRLRFDHNEMTQEELAHKAGCTRQTIIALEANKYTPSLALAFRIARAFDRQVEEVFTYDETKAVGLRSSRTEF